MKGLLVVILVIMLHEAKTSLVSCPSTADGNVLISHQFECSSFFLCDQTSAKPSFLLRCPVGYYFNSGNKNRSCTEADEMTCVPQLEVTPVLNKLRAQDLPAVDPPDSYRNYTLNLPNPSNCKQFYRYEGWNEPQLFECPDNLHFNPVLEICDLAQEVNCRDNECQNIPEPECPANNDSVVHLPHPTDCGSFYMCNWGTPILFNCPDNLYFNPDSGICDWPRNVECNRCN